MPGHIPGAVNVPARSLTDEKGRFLPVDELRAVLMRAGVDGERPVATYCGSGGQASHVSLAIAVAAIQRSAACSFAWMAWPTRRAAAVSSA